MTLINLLKYEFMIESTIAPYFRRLDRGLILITIVYGGEKPEYMSYKMKRPRSKLIRVDNPRKTPELAACARGAWWATVHSVAQSWTHLKQLSSSKAPVRY